MEELTLWKQHQQYLSGLGEAIENPRSLQARLKSKLVKAMGMGDIKIVKLFKTHCICATRDDQGHNVFYRVSFVLGDYPLVSIGDIQAVKDDEEDKVATALGAPSIEQKMRQRRMAGLFETKGFGAPSIGNGSFEDLRSALGDALKSRFGNAYAYVIATYPEKVIARVTTDGEEANTYYKIPYKVKSGQIELGDSVKVEKKTSFVKSESRAGSQQLTEMQKWQQRLALHDLVDGQSGLITESAHKPELVEICRAQCVILEKATKTNGLMKVSGIASEGNRWNDNNRYYKTELLARACDQQQEKLKSGRMLGTLDHPKDGKTDLSRVCFKYTKLEMDGNLMKFEAEVLPTPSGQIVKNLLKSGVGIDISTRSYAMTKQEKIDGTVGEVVQDDLEIVAIDPVAGHSCKAAQVTSFSD